jgi:ribonuclease G
VKAELLINVSPGEVRAAMIEDGILVDLVHARGHKASLVGNIYFARVTRLMPGMNAAFVDIGTGRSGFIDLDGARPAGDGGRRDGKRIGDFLTEGEAILVSVTKDASGRKGVELSRRIGLPGRYLVYTPFQQGVAVSRQIGAAEEQDRLRNVVGAFAKPDEGFIARTAAAGASAEDLAADAESLRDAWSRVVAAQSSAEPPALLHAELDPVLWLLRDMLHEGVQTIRIDNPAKAQDARDFAARYIPWSEDRIVLHSDDEPLFERFNVEDAIEQALSPRVPLPNGGFIVIESTEALTAIDVNSGGFVGRENPEETALAINLDAAREIARQLRLRNIGGLIVVDLINMDAEDARRRVLDEITKACARDRTPTRVIGLTEAGLIEITRRRRRESLAQLFTDPCAPCEASGRVRTVETVALDLLRAIVREARVGEPGTLIAYAAGEVVGTLSETLRPALEEAAAMTGRRIVLRRGQDYARTQYEVTIGAEQ